jgi:DNA-directed RNA polymerase subunit RPC12/RpoP
MIACPRCGKNALEEENPALNALSRTTRRPEDTPVYVCSPCGTDEAMEDWLHDGATPQEKWPLNGFAVPDMVESIQRASDLAITEKLEELL